MNGHEFTLITLGVIALALFLTWLYTSYAANIRDPKREAEWNAEMRRHYGPYFRPEPSRPHVTTSRGNTFRYRTPDWEAMRTAHKTGHQR